MDLVDLDPHFLRIEAPGEYQYVDTVGEADGVMFLCPVCFKTNGGPVRTHQIICWQPHVPQTEHPTPGRWLFKGTGYGDLTLVNGSSSIFLTGEGCKAHFFVRGGKIV